MKATRKRRRSLNFESLEGRKLFASISGPDADGLVRIEGTAGDDRIVVKPTSELITNQIRHHYVKIEVEDERTGRRLVSQTISADDHPNLRFEIDAGNGNDHVLNLTDRPSRIEGGHGNDWLIGGRAVDEIFGGTGHDHLSGGKGDDVLYGGSGRDILIGGEGRDRYPGKESQDVVRYHEPSFPEPDSYVAPSRQIIRNSPGQWEANTIIVKGDNHANRITIDQYWWGELRINVSRIGDDFEAAAFSHEWQPRVARDAVLKIYGLDGNDEIINRSNLRTYIYAGDGHDRVVTGSNGHFVFGGSGNDAIYGGAGGDYLNGNDGHDLLYGEGAIDILVGGNDNDILYGGDSHDVLYGQAGRDLLYGGIGDDTLRGGSGNDDLYGSSGYDRLYGDSGRDRLDGGFDGTRDYLHGGSGLNTFVQHRDWSNRVEQELWADYPASTVTVDPYAFLGSMSLLPLIV